MLGEAWRTQGALGRGREGLLGGESMLRMRSISREKGCWDAPGEGRRKHAPAERTEAQRPDGKRAGVPGNVAWLEKMQQGGGLAARELSWGEVRKTPLWETGALFWGPWGKPLLCFRQRHEASIL